jgi:DNA-binding CsgD family transcriptional regulator
MKVIRRKSPIHTLAYPVIAVDAQDRIVDWNRAAELAFGVPTSKALGRHAQELLRAYDIFGNPTCPHGCFLHELARQGEVANSCEWDLHGLGEGSRRFSVTFETLRDSPTAYTLIYHLRPDRRNEQVRRRTDSFSTGRQLGDRFSRGTGPVTLARLTPRESEVLRLVGRGASTTQIAKECGISTVTVRNHIERMMQKLGAHSRVEAASIAHQSRIL